MTTISERSTPTALTPVRVVDNDVHPTPRLGEFEQFLAPAFRELYTTRHQLAGNPVYYDPPDYNRSLAMRTDAFPGDGNCAGSDPDLLFEQLIRGAGSDIAILAPLITVGHTEQETQYICEGLNRWLEACWLHDSTNWHGRYRGSISAAVDDPIAAAAEIERWGEDPRMVQVLINAEPKPAWGHPRYDAVWQAAVNHGLPVACHLNRGQHHDLPMSPVGFMTYNHDMMVGYSMLAANQVVSLIFDGVFDRFPTLQIVLIEHGFNWILPLLWRMDAAFDMNFQGAEPLPRRRPSEYVYDNIWFTTQPLDYPDDKIELANALEWMGADRLLMYSSDYPHWTFDDPQWLAKHLPARWREQIMATNALNVFRLPKELPAIANQRRPI